jgi:hypothetical protein
VHKDAICHFSAQVDEKFSWKSMIAQYSEWEN